MTDAVKGHHSAQVTSQPSCRPFQTGHGMSEATLALEQRQSSTIQAVNILGGLPAASAGRLWIAIFVPKRLLNKGGMKDEQHRKSIYDRSDDRSYLGGRRHRVVPRPPAFNNAHGNRGSRILRLSTGYGSEGLC